MPNEEGGPYVFLTTDLFDRDDFYEKTRFKHYQECIFNFSSKNKGDSSCRGSYPADEASTDKSPKNPSPLNRIDVLLSSNGNGYTPIFEAGANKNGGPGANKAEYFINDPEDESVKFALLSVDKATSLFTQIIQKRIPFAFICPDGPKCEWFKISFSDDNHYRIECAEEKQCKKQCSFHETIYSSEEINKTISQYGISFKTAIKNVKIDKIPIFELSTAIDIVRWWQFYQDYINTKYQTLLNEKLLISQVENVFRGAFEKIGILK